MLRQNCSRSIVAGLAAVAVCNLCKAGSTQAVDKCFEKLPPGWTIRQTFMVPRDQAAAIGKKLGSPIRKLSNTVLAVHGKAIQVNILECRTIRDAEKLHKRISGMKGHPAFCLRRAGKVIEFVGNDVALAIKAGYELGFRPKPTEIRYRIDAQVVPVDKSDYMSFNRLFNLFLAMEKNPRDKKIAGQITELAKKFRFGQQITLRMAGTVEARPAYRFEPSAIKSRQGIHGELMTYTFKNMPEKLSIPYVSIVAEVSTRSDGRTVTARKDTKGLLSATEFWPVDEPAVVSVAKKITKGRQTKEAKVAAILKWLTPGRNIRFGGPFEGSRWGVKRVLKQGFGQCWDFSDCFITLSRASGIPCRQVGGWLYGSSGHIWAEVLSEDKGWQQVDPTGGSVITCGIYHIPYFTSEDGHMPILYVSMPNIKPLSNSNHEKR